MMNVFNFWNKSAISKYHDAKEDLECYEEAVRNISSFSDKQLDKHHELIKRVRRLKKQCNSEIALIDSERNHG